MFCPFACEECRSDCVFRCRRTANSSHMNESTTNCLIVSKLDSMNEGQADQLSEIITAIETLG